MKSKISTFGNLRQAVLLTILTNFVVCTSNITYAKEGASVKTPHAFENIANEFKSLANLATQEGTVKVGAISNGLSVKFSPTHSTFRLRYEPKSNPMSFNLNIKKTGDSNITELGITDLNTNPNIEKGALKYQANTSSYYGSCTHFWKAKAVEICLVLSNDGKIQKFSILEEGDGDDSRSDSSYWFFYDQSNTNSYFGGPNL